MDSKGCLGALFAIFIIFIAVAFVLGAIGITGEAAVPLVIIITIIIVLCLMFKDSLFGNNTNTSAYTSVVTHISKPTTEHKEHKTKNDIIPSSKYGQHPFFKR